jgi:hypothetical protein
VPSLQEFRTVVALAPSKPAGLADFGAPLVDTAVVKKGRVHEFLQALTDGTIGRRFQDLRVTGIRTVEAAVPCAKLFVQFEVFGDNTAAPANGVGFDAALYSGSQQLAGLSSSSLFLPYGNFWYPNRFVFDVPVTDFDRADRFEFIAKPEEVRTIGPGADPVARIEQPSLAPTNQQQCMTYPGVKRISHKMLGDMLRMMLSERLSFDLTVEEGKTLSRAFTAVAWDWRRTDLIYLSPIGSDHEFSAAVTQEGLNVETADGGHRLSWDDVTELAERLAVE